MRAASQGRCHIHVHAGRLQQLLPGDPAVVLAGEDRVWHPASMKIDGDKVIVTTAVTANQKKPKPMNFGPGGGGVETREFAPGLQLDFYRRRARRARVRWRRA